MRGWNQYNRCVHATVGVLLVAGLVSACSSDATEPDSNTAAAAPTAVQSADATLTSTKPVTDEELCEEPTYWFDFAHGITQLGFSQLEQQGGGTTMVLDELTIAQIARHVRETEVLAQQASAPELAAAADAVVATYNELKVGGADSTVQMDAVLAAGLLARDLTERCEIVLAESDLTP